MKIAINGFGRIGRLTLREIFGKKEMEVVAINDLTDTATLAHLLQYDSLHGRYGETVVGQGNTLSIRDTSIQVFSEKNPENLPWKELGIDLVIECTGKFRTKDTLSAHLKAGAQKVLLSAPGTHMKMVVLGVNHDILTPDDVLISNASCTTNCLAPMASVLHQEFGIVKGFMTTTHAYTANQNLLDGAHKDLRRARAAAVNIIPTTTGAAKALDKIIPDLKGKMDGFAMRVPTPTGSITDLSVQLSQDVSVEEINAAMQAAARGHLKGIMEYATHPLVSSDIIGHPASCIFDSALTLKIDDMVKVVGWYDNEYGYAARLVDLAELVLKL